MILRVIEQIWMNKRNRESITYDEQLGSKIFGDGPTLLVLHFL